MIDIEKIFLDLNYKDYYKDNSLDKLVHLDKMEKNNTSVYSNVDPKNVDPYPPDFNDLIRLHFLVNKFKSIKVLEFGVGYSTKVIAHSLSSNEKKYSDSLDGIRTDGYFKVFSVDSSRKYLNLTKNSLEKELLDYCEFSFSKLETVLVNNKITTQYKKIPNIRPDFIYIDGPSQWDGIEGSINGLDTKNIDRMPISSYVILFEYFLTPGTVIYLDGRTTNARFLLNNLQRNWKYNHFIEEDVHLFLLDESPLGEYNKKHLEFIFKDMKY